MIVQTDLVIAVRVITTPRPDTSKADIEDELRTAAQNVLDDLHSTVESLSRTNVVDHSAGGISVTTTVVQE